MCRLLSAALLLLACSCASSSNTRIDVVIQNYTDHPIMVRASINGIVLQQLNLQPGETWNGFIDKRWPGTEAEIRLLEGKKKEEKPAEQPKKD
jgi:type IV pilus biogenesis protein CpaD/CtpE